MAQFDGWFTPLPRSARVSTRSALVIMTETRASVATTLILQELGMSVDVGSEPAYVLRWLKRAHYDLIVAGGPGIADADFAARLREVAPTSRIALLPDDGISEAEASLIDVDLLEGPVDVNRMVESFLPQAA